MSRRAERSRRRTAGRRARVAVAGVLLLGAAAGGVVTTARLLSARDHREDLAAVNAYLARIEPLARAGGRVVQEGVKPSVADLQAGTAGADLESRASGWESELSGLLPRWQDVRPPASLARAHDRFLAALRGYREAAIVVRTAAAASAAEQRRLARNVIDAGEAADRLFDEAARDVQDRLRAFGAQPVHWLPEPTSSAG